MSKDLRKNEAIDWKDHATLNNVTKSAIQFFESNFSYENFMEEKVAQEASAAQ